jgi:hypothetical protein
MVLDEDPPGSQSFVLALGGRRWRVGAGPATDGDAP